MSLSKDIKIMLELLKQGKDIPRVIQLLEKWDKVNDDFYNQPHEVAPLSLRRQCPCYQSAERNNGHVRDSGSNGACITCRISGSHNEERCERAVKYGCEWV